MASNNKKKVGPAGSGRTGQPERTDLIWGIHPVMELLQSAPDRIIELRILKATHTKVKDLVELADRQGVSWHLAESPFSGTPEQATVQGVQARTKPVATVSMAEVIAARREGTGPALVLALDTIQDPHNFGAMIRSASAAGALAILYTKDRSAPLSGTVAKVSVGAIAHLPLCPVTNMAAALQQLKDSGFWVFGADGSADKTIYEVDFSGPVCLVIGGERSGIRPLVKKQCDFLVSIPMRSDVDSLNASVAAAVIMFEIVRQQGS
ncbi:MAG: 23S rRNA (guanosine(2251)-2'-O)-methyltransferase RlmB [Proteobacteria bacterium]|nr:23S rRNA (guanosine(2251)-2'-O)-methyltransferase RlmB [Desulfobulbaceae bacterium]MBU4152207.1 23S rRNA (guanosine(2251)-2'-O)-methyltransferase RlmB [Pseudomonadota bacterium]MDP2106547.1 23S rRNA (guanosine(2251)-2'-O)-methyltransferase RlmB [Desulfobulbaceae bacterium]